jgi:hypothetical protein
MKRYLLQYIFLGAATIGTSMAVASEVIAGCSRFDPTCWFKTPEVHIKGSLPPPGLPNGSYWVVCRFNPSRTSSMNDPARYNNGLPYVINGGRDLFALCGNSQSIYRPSILENFSTCIGDIYNDDGRLACQRASISGNYRGVNVWGVLRVTNFNSGGNPLTFSADDNNENRYFTHFTNGALVSIKSGELIWNITTRRTNRSNNCTTMMSGTLTQRSNNTARAVYTSTDGRCDIPTNFSSAIELRKN